MCGIAGFYGFRNDELINKISSELIHRGPDGEGFYIDDKITLLNRRLAIIDLARGAQPIYNEDKSVVVVYNGEIYNYQELRKKLEEKNHIFETESDTEVIVHGYEEWGEKCFDVFNGMFGVALYDIKKEKLILVRDHFGIKPLYYSVLTKRVHTVESVSPSHDTCQIIFSSEIKPIINSGLIEKKPNDRIIYRYLKYRIHDDNKETFFDDVYKLMPGEMMIIDGSKYKIQNYSKLQSILSYSSSKVEKNIISSRQARTLNNKEIIKFKKELIKAITYRLISDVPVGTCLSGGLDSSIVVAIVNRLLDKKVKESKSLGKKQKTYSAVFPGSSNNEEKYIDEVIKFIKLKSHKVNPKPEEFFEEINEFVKTQEEPTISTGPYAQYKVMETAHKDIKVLLDGQGSDEMMAGYLPYYFVYLKQLIRERRVRRVIREMWGMSDVLLKYGINKLKEKVGIKKIVNLSNLINDDFNKRWQKENFTSIDDNLKARLIEDVFHNSLPSLLRYEDKNSMRFSIEGRVPFLDFNLIKYIFSLSDEAIINNGWNKYILRNSIRDLLPETIVNRRNKIGFITPEHEWFMRMKNKIYLIFLSDSFGKRKYFNQKEVLKAFQEFIEGKNNDTMVYWRMLNLELWLKEFIDTPVNKVHNVIKFIKNEIGPNEGKKLDIKIDNKKFLRYPIKTDLFKKGDDYVKKISNNIVKWLNCYIVKNNNESMKQWNNSKWFVVVSEKIVAISQGRSYFIWNIKPTFIAKILSNFVTRTPYGIGLGSPWTFQIAINEVGLVRILLASLLGGLGKVGILGKYGKGIFYKVVGPTVASIDGPTEYSLYPSNVSAKLGPKDPEKAASDIKNKIVKLLNGYIVNNNEATRLPSPSGEAIGGQVKQFNNVFLGVAIIDANDLGRNVLGNSTSLSNREIEEIFKDNPMGQADEQTPIVIVVSSKE